MFIISDFFAGAYFGEQVNPIADIISSADKTFHWNIAITYWLSGSISGILFLAIGTLLDRAQEIIKNQHAIMTKFEIPFEEPAQEPVEEIREDTIPNLGE